MTTPVSHQRGIRTCHRVTVTEIVVIEGSGRSDDDPVREVTYFYDDDGWLIAKRDGWAESNPPEEVAI